ncbi:CvpA family protein [Patescibacteria group bacterium]|nr:CvpA family protein [Patescibacteria group bacterium]MBU4453231.1 CvpA family protein [Patescibacteria group bacterium]MCG2687781.1 CvpA family protein [Candidatus Parcubacteria bacterium]
MTLTLADLALLIIAGLFIISGLYYGFIRTVGSLIGMVGGIFVAVFAIEWLDSVWGISSHPILQIALFIIIMGFASQLIGWIFELIDRAYKLLTIIPFLSSINKLLGGIVGAIEAFVVLSGIIYYATTYLSDGAFKSAILDSQVVTWLSFASGWVVWIVGLFV